MAIIGIRRLIWRVEDIPACTRFFTDFGLTPVETGLNEALFEAADGSQSLFLKAGDPRLPQGAVQTGKGVPECVWAVDSSESLARLVDRLERIVPVRTDSAGAVHFITLFGQAIGLEVWQPRAVFGAPTPHNTVGRIARLNQPRNMLGVGEAAVEAGYAYRGARFLDMKGEVLKELPGDTAVDGLPSDLGLTRPALHKVLTDKVRALGIPVRLGVTFECFEDRGNHVDVRFTDGSSASFDLVIGADGNYSAVRNALWPEALPQFTGQGVWRYNVPRPAGLEWSDIYIGKAGGKAGYCPLTPTEMYIFAVFEEPGNPRFAPETLASEMRRRLEGYGGLLGKAAMHITDPALVVYRPLEACIMPAPWFKGRVVLLGDAAHSATPHLGQGAAMAIEDAVVLAEELSDRDVDAALAAFMERRFERAKLVGTSSIQLGEWEMHPETAGDPIALTDRIRRKLAETV